MSNVNFATWTRLRKDVLASETRRPPSGSSTDLQRGETSSTAEVGKARQTASRDGRSDLNPAKWKAGSTKGRGTPATLSHCLNSQDFSSSFTLAGWRRAPSSSPWHQPGDPPWTQLGLITSIFPGSQGFVVEILPEGPNFGSSSQTFVEKLQSICWDPKLKGSQRQVGRDAPSRLWFLPETRCNISPWLSRAGTGRGFSPSFLPCQNHLPEKRGKAGSEGLIGTGVRA